MKKIDITTCYHCDSESTGREHVPPKCLFPKGEDWPELITVPSCVKHNNENSTADEYLKFILGASTSNIPDPIRSGVARSAIRIAQKRSRNLHRYGLQWDRDTLVIEKDFPLNFELLSTCLEKIARALYFYHHCGQRKLLGALKVIPLFIPVDASLAPELASVVSEVQAWTAQDFENLPRLGPHQEIFAYQVIDLPKSVVISMQFYGAHRVSAMAHRSSITMLDSIVTQRGHD